MKTIALVFVFALAVCAQTQQHSVTLVWQDAANPAGTTYNVYKATGLCSGSPSFNKIATAVTAKTYQDADVPPGNVCYYVTAVSSGVESAPSNSALAPVPSFAPTNLVPTIAMVQVAVPSQRGTE